MSFRSDPGLEVEVVAVRARATRPSLPPAMWLFAGAMAVSLAVAALGGLTLGILAGTNSGIARSRWTEVVQAHGALQLWGWTAVFVTALAFEFVIRFNQRSPLPVGRRVGVLGLLGCGALVAAAGRVVGEAEQPLAVAGAALVLGGAVGFGAMIVRVPAARPLRADLNPLFFRAGAVWLVVSAAVTLHASARMESGIAPLEETRLAAEVFLRGFVTSIVLAVGLRAFPGHLGLPAPGVRAQRMLFGLITASLVAWCAGIAAFGLPGNAWLQRLGDFGFAAAIVVATWSFGMTRAVRAWGRGSERYQVMVPLAWLGLVAYGVCLVVQAISRIGGDPLNVFESGAARHIFLLGFMAPLMVAMAHIVLARFGTGRVAWRDGLTLAFGLLMVAWPLRVIPPLIDPSVGTGSQRLLGVAGGLAAAGLGLAAVVAARNAVGIARRVKEMG